MKKVRITVLKKLLFQDLAEKYIQVLCCTDGVRPVVFLLEAFEEQ